jgi:hypothetical protein
MITMTEATCHPQMTMMMELRWKRPPLTLSKIKEKTSQWG